MDSTKTNKWCRLQKKKSHMDIHFLFRKSYCWSLHFYPWVILWKIPLAIKKEICTEAVEKLFFLLISTQWLYCFQCLLCNIKRIRQRGNNASITWEEWFTNAFFKILYYHFRICSTPKTVTASKWDLCYSHSVTHTSFLGPNYISCYS